MQPYNGIAVLVDTGAPHGQVVDGLELKVLGLLGRQSLGNQVASAAGRTRTHFHSSPQLDDSSAIAQQHEPERRR